MMAMIVGMMVLLAAMSILDSASRQNRRVQKRAGAIQQGRFAVDEVVRRMRSQVCISPDAINLLPPISAASGSTVTFYSDFTDGNTGLPERHTLTVTAGGALTDAVTKGAGTRQATTFTGTTTTRTVAQRIVPPTNGVPAFQYFAFNTATPATATTPLNTLTSPTVAAADLPRIARIVVTLKANPEGKVDDKLAATMQDEVYVRLADPDDAAPTPKCA